MLGFQLLHIIVNCDDVSFLVDFVLSTDLFFKLAWDPFHMGSIEFYVGFPPLETDFFHTITVRVQLCYFRHFTLFLCSYASVSVLLKVL